MGSNPITVPSFKTIDMKKKTKYIGLRIVAGVIWATGLLIFISSVVFSIITQYEDIRVLAGSIIIGSIIGVVFWAISGMINVFMDIEYNTRR